MDQDIEIINSNTRIEKIKSFLSNYKKQLISILSITILIIFGFFFYQDYKSSKKEELAKNYNILVTKFNLGQKEEINNGLINIVIFC